MEKENTFLGLYGSFFKRFEGLSYNERISLLKEMTMRVRDLYPQYFKKLANNNETTEEKMENRTEEIYEPIDTANRAMFMPKSPEVKPYNLSEHGKL